MSKGIKYTRGSVEHLAGEYYTLVLYNGMEKVYQATISKVAAKTWGMKNNITFKDIKIIRNYF